MGTQLRASIFVDGPSGEETEIHEEIPRVVASDPGAVTLQVGRACVTFSSRSELIALVSAV